jgi:hypothetical protein
LVGIIKQPPGHWKGRRKTETSKFSTTVFNNIYYNKLHYAILYNHVIHIWSSVLEWKYGTVQHSIKDPPRTWLHRTLSKLSQKL